MIAAPKHNPNIDYAAQANNNMAAGKSNVPQGPASQKAIEAALKRAQQTGNLNLQGKGLKAFPSDICNFNELRLIDNFWEAYDLQKVDLSNNEIESIPEEIVNQETVVSFNFNTNKLAVVPNGLFALPTLKFLDLSHNILGTKAVPNSYLSEAIGQCQSLVELHLAGNQLTHLPESLGDLANLEILNAKDNKLQALPYVLASSTD
eukprot:CAMPEP_0185575716 /NCGR_PEP_ID=MMETSP0434-20130131/6828_1 /TAXON_ID=626734 ORGANISM="Favella taraikaensis, Strain Fe Narragansett Bay" /NCGR_SAMPLE_ID=MMETSP0434 /ASSEMBLY_ACC=CAM_ASM_000379 /LENGTH=204 /DNA_ID=CAMNT_0028192665 /DNA_START=63 /DNA_END=678 /DNA_ORIENTATION=+